MNTKWYADEAAKRTHAAIEYAIKPMCEKMMPNHLFTHMGINRNELTNEIVIKLHLRPIGEAVWINERLNRGNQDLLK
jgi:hypothetical protein